MLLYINTLLLKTSYMKTSLFFSFFVFLVGIALLTEPSKNREYFSDKQIIVAKIIGVVLMILSVAMLTDCVINNAEFTSEILGFEAY